MPKQLPVAIISLVWLHVVLLDQPSASPALTGWMSDSDHYESLVFGVITLDQRKAPFCNKTLTGLILSVLESP